MRVLIGFDGTHIEKQNRTWIENNNCSPDVVRIYFKGCHAPETGGNGLFPDITGMAGKLAKLFNQNELDLDELKKTFGSDVSIEPFDSANSTEQTIVYGKLSIDEMAFVGYSRGCIASFALARQLYLNENTIPVRIIANQPVPGNAYSGWNTLVSEVTDLSMCTNIHSASLVIGSYANQFGLSGKTLLTSYFHKLFFKQVMPLFSPQTKADIRECPIQSHFSTDGVGLGYLHMLRTLEEHNYCKLKYSVDKQIKIKIQQNETIFLLDSDDKQAIFGDASNLNTDPLVVQVIDDWVNKILDWNHSTGAEITLWEELSIEQKKAIYSLSSRGMNAVEISPLLNMILSNDANGKKLATLINSSTGMIAHTLSYLRNLSSEETCHEKISSIMAHKNDYLKEIFLLSGQFLKLKSPTQQDTKALTENLVRASKTLLNDVTSKHANPVWDVCVTIIQNLVLGVLTLGGAFIYNTIKNHSVFFIKKPETCNQLLLATEKTNELLLQPSA